MSTEPEVKTEVKTEQPPKITAVEKTKHPGCVAHGKKLAALRAEKKRLAAAQKPKPEPEPESSENCDNDETSTEGTAGTEAFDYNKAIFAVEVASVIVGLISIPFIYHKLFGGTETKKLQGPPEYLKRDLPDIVVPKKKPDLLSFD